MADTEIEIIECRDCESKNCHGCNVLTLSQMLNQGKFDSLMDEHHSINPAADVVEVVRGRWKYYKKQGIAVCTNCSFERNVDDNFGRAVACPNCGARMEEDEDGL